MTAGASSHRWLGHSSVLLTGHDGRARVAVDPWRWRDDTLKADLVLVTHAHADHCSEEDLVAASHATTEALGPASVRSRLAPIYGERLHVVSEGERREVAGIRVSVYPAEGPPRAAGFHPRGEGVSYLVELGGRSYLFLGDSVALPEHEGLAPDVAFVAIGGLAVMDPEEAAESAARIRPGTAVPVHWGDLNGRFDLAVRFATKCRAHGVRVDPAPARR